MLTKIGFGAAEAVPALEQVLADRGFPERGLAESAAAGHPIDLEGAITKALEAIGS